MNRSLPIVGVMGSGADQHEEWAVPLGRLVALKSAHLLTGAGLGTMTSVSKAFTESENRKGLSLGVVPAVQRDGQEGFFNKPGYPNPYVELVIKSPLGTYGGDNPRMISRNHINIMTSDTIVALPGNVGTLNEVHICLWLKKPVIMFGPDELFAAFPKEVERTQDIKRVENFLDETLKFSNKAE